MLKNRRYLFSIIVVIYFSSIQFAIGQEVPKEGLDSITPKDMKEHVYYLASDEMKGRNTPSPELDSCAAFIAKEFADYGLQAVGKKNTYFQYFNLTRTSLAGTNTVEVTSGAEKTVYQLKRDFVPLHLTANRKAEGGIVFAGYGITAPEYNYDDYKSIDATGKFVLMFTSEPQEKDTSSVFDGRKKTDHSKFRVKIENAMDHGAIGVILVGNPNKRFRRPPNHWPSLMKNAPPDAVPLTKEEKAENKIVCIQIGKKLVDNLIVNTGFNLKKNHQKIDSTLTPQSFEIKDKTIAIETELKEKKYRTQNVIGLLEGSDPELKNEYIIIGAHYDHVGVINEEVYNGADDNASGTAGIMEIAQAFSKSPAKPERSIVFMTFAAEEKGLYGSKHYVDNPIFPLEKTIAMLNLDMISRNDSTEIAIIGSTTSDSLKKINEDVAKVLNITLAYDQEKYFLNSDHYSFYKKNIPVLFYSSKSTPDLHKPTDDPEKVIPEKMALVGKLIFSTAWKVANCKEKPDFIKVR